LRKSRIFVAHEQADFLRTLANVVVLDLDLDLFAVLREDFDVEREDCSSLMNTLNDSGTPGSITFSPLTIAS
jgi:hypothetical protein